MQAKQQVSRKVVVFLKENHLFDAKRAPEATLGRPKRRVKDQRGARSKKEASKSQKVWFYLRNFMFFQETLNHIHEIQVKVDIGESTVAEIGGRKSGVTIVKKESNSTFNGHGFFQFFLADIEFDSINTCQSRHWKVPCSKTHCFFCYFENEKVDLENEKVFKSLMKLIFFG